MTDLSVAIPCYNESETIQTCLESIGRQRPGMSVEVLVCDDASTDNTRDILAAWTEQYSTLLVLHNETNQGMLTTTQRLLQASEGDVVLKIDADCQVKDGSLRAAYEHLQDHDILYGKVGVSNTDKLHPAACQYGKERGSGSWFGGACVGFTRDILSETDCFADVRQNLERELMNRADREGWSIVKTDMVSVESEFPESIREWLPRKFNSGRIYVRECADSPAEFEWSEMRGPLFWTSAVVLGLISSVIGVVLLTGYYLAQMTQLHNVPKEFRWRGLYPSYKILSGVARTFGVWTELPLLAKTVWRKYTHA